MAEPHLFLESIWIDDGSETGRMQMRLSGAPDILIDDRCRLAFTAITRIPPDTKLENATFLARTANYHELAPLAPSQISEKGVIWDFVIPKLSHRPSHVTDGPKSAFLVHPDGSTQTIECAPLRRQGDPAPSHEPVGAEDAISSPPHSETPILGAPVLGARLGMLPSPKQSVIEAWCEDTPLAFSLPQGNETADHVQRLYARLFGEDICSSAAYGAVARPVVISQQGDDIKAQGSESYVLRFSQDEIAIEAQGEGLFYALVSLCQLWRAAVQDPGSFGFPLVGVIVDEPKQVWRGMHLDVSRQVYTVDAIRAFLDILAWNKLNRFHWHLTDDEGWRLESLAYPQLTTIGAWRGLGLPILPQHGSGPEKHGGFFSRQDVASILAHAKELHVDVVPEVDVPGHCFAALASLPELVDPSAMAGGVSVQGYVNNALNPGLTSTWQFLETIFGELCEQFPSRYIHMGGDEVAEGAWQGSRAAMSWARGKGHVDEMGQPDSMKMQAAMLRFVSKQISNAGKVPLAWEEAAKGGGLDPDEAILMAWMKADSGYQLAKDGYRVIMCPGEAYYLDMAQSQDWQEPGLSWAGISSPRHCYDFDPISPVGEHAEKVLGIQGCIWSENLISCALFKHMVFPRLSAIAESGWSMPERKDWDSFVPRSCLMPTLPS